MTVNSSLFACVLGLKGRTHDHDAKHKHADYKKCRLPVSNEQAKLAMKNVH